MTHGLPFLVQIATRADVTPVGFPRAASFQLQRPSMLTPSLHRATIRRAPPCNARSVPRRLNQRPERRHVAHRVAHPARALVPDSPDQDPLPPSPESPAVANVPPSEPLEQPPVADTPPPELLEQPPVADTPPPEPLEQPPVAKVSSPEPLEQPPVETSPPDQSMAAEEGEKEQSMTRRDREKLKAEVLWNVRQLRMGKAAHLFRLLRKEDLNEGLIAQMIKGFLQKRLLPDCWKFYRQARDLGFEPSVFLYTLMLKCCAVGLDRGAAVKLWQEIQARSDIEPSKILYNAYMHVFMKVGDVPRALALLQEMKDKSIEIDIVTYNTLLTGISRQPQQKFTEALVHADTLVKELTESGYEFQARTYQALARISTRKGEARKAMRFMDEVIQKDLDMEEEEAQLFINNVAVTRPRIDTQKILERCWKLFLHSEKKNGLASVALVESLLQLFVSFERWNNVFGVLSAFEARNQRVTRHMYDILLKGLATGKQVGREGIVTARILLDEFRKREYTMTPEMYVSVVKLFIRARAFDEANFYIEQMKSENIQPTTAIYDIMLGYHADGRYTRDWEKAGDEAMRLWKEMREKKVQMSSVTYTTLVTVLTSAGRPLEIERLLAETKLKSIVMQTSAYNKIFQMYAEVPPSKAMADAAWTLLEDVKRARIPVNVMTYNSMIAMCAAAGDLTNGLKLLAEMKETSAVPNAQTYKTLIQLAGNEGNLNLTFELFNEVLTVGLNADTEIYTMLIKACGNAGEIDKVLQVHEDMKIRGMPLNSVLFCDSVTAAADCNRADLIYRFYDEFLHLKKPLSHDAYALLSEALQRSGDAEGAAAILELEKEEDRLKRNVPEVAH